jgi:hypothetical protein
VTRSQSATRLFFSAAGMDTCSSSVRWSSLEDVFPDCRARVHASVVVLNPLRSAGIERWEAGQCLCVGDTARTSSLALRFFPSPELPPPPFFPPPACLESADAVRPAFSFCFSFCEIEIARLASNRDAGSLSQWN